MSALGAKLKRQFKPKTENQAVLLKSLESKILTIVCGPAGSGKTFMSCGFAARMLFEKKVDRIVITRPIVSCGRGYGFLPGEKDAKLGPTMRPLLDALEQFMGRVELDRLIKDGVIEILPLDDMRGCSLPKTFIICDEAQNATFTQLHMLLTRFGEGSKVVLSGDDSTSQTDINESGEKNPLREVIKRFTPALNEHIGIVRLTRKDIVRHFLLTWIDERLVEGPPQGWLSCKCPKCSNKIWYDEKAELEGLIVACCWCGIAVDLIDDDGGFDPVEFHTKETDLQSYKHDPGKVASSN